MLSFSLVASRRRDPSGSDTEQLIRLIGHPAFAAAVLRQFGHSLGASHCSILSVDSINRSCRIDAASFEGEGALVAGNAYVDQGFFSHDRAFSDVRESDSQDLVHVVTRADILSSEHRHLCFDTLDIAERCSVVTRLGDGAAVSANFYRCTPRGPFADGEFHFLSENAPLLLAALAKHHECRIAGFPRADGAALFISSRAAVVAQLSSRERDVVERCVRGLSAKEIARELGIAVTTVNTLKQRAYQRLGVRRQSELIALISGTRHHT